MIKLAEETSLVLKNGRRRRRKMKILPTDGAKIADPMTETETEIVTERGTENGTMKGGTVTETEIETEIETENGTEKGIETEKGIVVETTEKIAVTGVNVERAETAMRTQVIED